MPPLFSVFSLATPFARAGDEGERRRRDESRVDQHREPNTLPCADRPATLEASTSLRLKAEPVALATCRVLTPILDRALRAGFDAQRNSRASRRESCEPAQRRDRRSRRSTMSSPRLQMPKHFQPSVRRARTFSRWCRAAADRTWFHATVCESGQTTKPGCRIVLQTALPKLAGSHVPRGLAVAGDSPVKVRWARAGRGCIRV